jgi:hypothetical protein
MRSALSQMKIRFSSKILVIFSCSHLFLSSGSQRRRNARVRKTSGFVQNTLPPCLLLCPKPRSATLRSEVLHAPHVSVSVVVIYSTNFPHPLTLLFSILNWLTDGRLIMVFGTDPLCTAWCGEMNRCISLMIQTAVPQVDVWLLLERPPPIASFVHLVHPLC